MGRTSNISETSDKTEAVNKKTSKTSKSEQNSEKMECTVEFDFEHKPEKGKRKEDKSKQKDIDYKEAKIDIEESEHSNIQHKENKIMTRKKDNNSEELVATENKSNKEVPYTRIYLYMTMLRLILKEKSQLRKRKNITKNGLRNQRKSLR
ncbi:hypothetical protein DPMN_178767 [Dreissena polymorpha]|uniref:Uncharacterized protein n=1 Tax=Dreissena polymorpha TaxID=45954 RepID=A0A9D4EBK2_DREPO|nr:hypothetical protein DPMN_178767 [Dreissena polymorpha]